MMYQLTKAISIFIFIWSFSFSTIAQSSKKNNPKVKVNFTKLSGFSLKPEAEPKSGYFTQLFARKIQFDQHFNGSGGKISSQINFEKFVVLACAVPKSKFETNISLEKILKDNGVMKVYFITTIGKKPETKKTIPQAMYTMAQDNSIYGIDYFVDGKMVMDLRN